MNIKMSPTTLSGQFRLVVSEDAAGDRVKHDTGFFDNLITNVGMNQVGVVNTEASDNISAFHALCGRFVVGSGSTTPAFTDTALVAPVAFASADPVLESESISYERGWYEITVKHLFEQGQVMNNLSEIGIQHTSLTGPLWSRTLILDTAGNPTSIKVLPEDFLTCYYTLRIMIPKQDSYFIIDADYDEDGLETTGVRARPLMANSLEPKEGWGLQTVIANNEVSLQFYTGGLAEPTADIPLGSAVGDPTDSFSIVPYVTDSYQRFLTRTNQVDEHNGEELRTAVLLAPMGCWQIEFNPPLQKYSTQTMDLTFGYSWARA